METKTKGAFNRTRQDVRLYDKRFSPFTPESFRDEKCKKYEN